MLLDGSVVGAERGIPPGSAGLMEQVGLTRVVG